MRLYAMFDFRKYDNFTGPSKSSIFIKSCSTNLPPHNCNQILAMLGALLSNIYKVRSNHYNAISLQGTDGLDSALQ